MSHLAVLSVLTPSSSARTSAAAADGARPTTDPVPCSASQTALRPASAVDFPVPAGPTNTSTHRREVAIFSTASAWSTDRRWFLPGRFSSVILATVGVVTDGAPLRRALSRRRASASSKVSVV
jgi:hypothetical protein